MKDLKRQEHRGGSSATGGTERRSAQRQPFVAEAQIVEISSGVRLTARSCDLVVHGCYVDTLMPFLPGTPVRIRLNKGNTIFEANGNVVYRLPALGMGIAFHEITPENHAVLDKWLSQMRVQHQSLLPSIEFDQPTISRRQPTAEFVQLVELLMKKTILTKTEAIGLLKGLDE